MLQSLGSQRVRHDCATEQQQPGCPGWLRQRGQAPLAGQRWGPYRGRAQVPALPGVGREVVQDEVPQRAVEVLAYGEEDSVRPWPQAARPPDPRLRSHAICSPPKTASSPSGDRKAPAAPIRAEKAGSPALTLCHQPAPWFSHRCRSQARPRKPGSQRHGPRGWGQGDTQAGTDRQARNRDKSQSETGGAESEKERDEHERGRWKNREARRETGARQGSRQRKRRTQRHNRREAEEWREVRPTEKGKGKRPRKKNEDRQTDGLEKKKTAVRSGSAWAGRTQVRGGQGREGSRLIQSQSWTCTA